MAEHDHRLVGHVDAGKIVVVGLMGGNPIAGKDQGQIELAFPADRQGIVIFAEDQLDLPRLATGTLGRPNKGQMVVWTQRSIDRDLEFLKRPAVPKGRLQPVAFELLELAGEIVGRDVDSLGAQSASFTLVGGKKAVGLRQAGFDGRGVLGAAQRRAQGQRPKCNREKEGGKGCLPR